MPWNDRLFLGFRWICKSPQRDLDREDRRLAEAIPRAIRLAIMDRKTSNDLRHGVPPTTLLQVRKQPALRFVSEGNC
jgi:hypothetical protein